MHQYIIRRARGISIIFLACAVLLVLPGHAQPWSIVTYNGWKAKELKTKNKYLRDWCGPNHLAGHYPPPRYYSLFIKDINTGQEYDLPESIHGDYDGSDQECRNIYYSNIQIGAEDKTYTLYVYDRVLNKKAKLSVIHSNEDVKYRSLLSFSKKYLIGEPGNDKASLPDGSEITILPVKPLADTHIGTGFWARDDSKFYSFRIRKPSILCYDVKEKSHFSFNIPEFGDYSALTIYTSPDGKYLYIEYVNYEDTCLGCQSMLARWNTSDTTHTIDSEVLYFDDFTILYDGSIVYKKKYKLDKWTHLTKIFIKQGDKDQIIASFPTHKEFPAEIYAAPEQNKIFLTVSHVGNRVSRYLILSK